MWHRAYSDSSRAASTYAENYYPGGQSTGYTESSIDAEPACGDNTTYINYDAAVYAEAKRYLQNNTSKKDRVHSGDEYTKKKFGHFHPHIQRNQKKFCSICHVNCYDDIAWEIHLNGNQHKEKVEVQKNGVPGTCLQANMSSHKCDFCDMTYNTLEVYREHVRDNHHIKQAKLLIKQFKAIPNTDEIDEEIPSLYDVKYCFNKSNNESFYSNQKERQKQLKQEIKVAKINYFVNYYQSRPDLFPFVNGDCSRTTSTTLSNVRENPDSATTSANVIATSAINSSEVNSPHEVVCFASTSNQWQSTDKARKKKKPGKGAKARNRSNHQHKKRKAAAILKQGKSDSTLLKTPASHHSLSIPVTSVKATTVNMASVNYTAPVVNTGIPASASIRPFVTTGGSQTSRVTDYLVPTHVSTSRSPKVGPVVSSGQEQQQIVWHKNMPSSTLIVHGSQKHVMSKTNNSIIAPSADPYAPRSQLLPRFPSNQTYVSDGGNVPVTLNVPFPPGKQISTGMVNPSYASQLQNIKTVMQTPSKLPTTRYSKNHGNQFVAGSTRLASVKLNTSANAGFSISTNDVHNESITASSTRRRIRLSPMIAMAMNRTIAPANSTTVRSTSYGTSGLSSINSTIAAVVSASSQHSQSSDTASLASYLHRRMHQLQGSASTSTAAAIASSDLQHMVVPVAPPIQAATSRPPAQLPTPLCPPPAL